MRLARLRNQMLIAMGLPACWVQQGPEPSAGPPPSPPSEGSPAADRPAQDPAEPAPHATIAYATPPSGWTGQPFAAARCAPDTVPETVCGRSDAQHGPDVCGPTGQSLESFGNSRVSVTRYMAAANNALLAPFQLDPDATAGYQRSVSVPAETKPRYCCYSRCTPLDVHQGGRMAVPGPGYRVQERCIPAPPGGTRVPDPAHPACPAGIRLDGQAMPVVQQRGGQCCYGAVVAIPPPEERRYYRGRAARIDGQPVVAPIGELAAWRAEPLQPRVDALPPEVRPRLAAAWLRAAQMEHASIASFSALSLRLLALGAPPALIAAAHQAALDEIEHARVAFELASAYAGRSLGPARFDDAARLSTAGGFAELARETLIDGCINETAAALEAERAADLAEDPAVAAALRTIAADEARHAELAWAIVAWCVRAAGPSLVDDLRAALAAVTEVTAPSDLDADLARHGVLGEHALAAVRADTLAGVVEPCLYALAA